MTKLKLTWLLACLTAASLLPGAVNTDFRSKGCKLYGKYKVEHDGLHCSFSHNLIMRGAILPPVELPDNFQLETEFTLRANSYDGRIREEMTIISTGWCFNVRKEHPFAGGIRLGLYQHKQDVYSIVFIMGLGKDTAPCMLKPVKITPKTKHLITVKVQNPGEAVIFLDGKELDRFPIMDPIYNDKTWDCIIGARPGRANGFAGVIHRIDIKEIPASDCSIIPWGRQVFLPGEKSEIVFKTVGKVPVEKLIYTDKINGQKQLAADSSGLFRFVPETRLTAGDYSYTVVAESDAGKKLCERSGCYSVAMPRGDSFPIVMWLDAHNMFQALPEDEIIETGFNCTLTGLSSHLPLEERYNSEIQCKFRYLDRIMRQNHRWWDQVLTKHTGLYEYHGKYCRHGRNEEPFPASLAVDQPQVIERMRQFAEGSAKLYYGHPALQGVALNTEQRDHSRPSLDKAAQERYFKETGRKIPQEVNLKNPPNYRVCKTIGPDRIVEDNDELYMYYKWFWKDGDGWNPLNTLLHRTIRQYVTIPDFYTSFDPAVRTPPILGSGGEVDILNQWVYPYKDPCRTMGVVREQAAMASGRPGQKFTGMVQLITKRFEVTNSKKIKNGPTPEWFLRDRASYTTVPPDLLVEASWGSMAGGPIQGIMYYGLGSLYPSNRLFTGLRCTDPTSEPAMRKFFHEILAPMGPMIKRLPSAPARVALYESDVDTLYAGRGSWGWGKEWASGQFLQYANIPYEVVYHEMAAKGALNKYKAVFVPYGDVLSREEFNLLADFQKKGGIIIGSHLLVPGLMPDIFVAPIEYSSREPSIETAKKYITKSTDLRQKLTGHVEMDFEVSPGLIAAPKAWHNDRYIVVINDRRTFGPLLGPWKLVREKAEPNNGSVTVKGRYDYVYDLTGSGDEMPKAVTDNGTVAEVKFAGAGGKILLFRRNPLPQGSWRLAKNAKIGGTVTASLIFAGKDNKICLPAEITIKDQNGRLIFRNHECVVDGLWSKEILLPLNAAPGNWTLTAKVRGIKKPVTATLKVSKEQ